MSLKDDLNSYLNKSSSTAPSLSSLTGKLKLPTFKSPFGGEQSEDQEPFLDNEDNGGSSSSWFGPKASSTGPSWIPSLSKKQRIFGVMSSLLLGMICFGLAMAYIPFIVIKARKFSLLFSLGSLFTVFSFSFLYGPWNHVMMLTSRERLPFSLTYLLTLSGTLYFAMALQSTVLTCVAAVAQVAALVWFIVSYVPGGQTGLKFFSKLFTGLFRSGASKTLPV